MRRVRAELRGKAEGPASGHARPASAGSPAEGAGVTPSMAQFLEIKAANPDSLLWYRMGDFYELFFEDAIAASEALGIVLTKRGKHLGQDIPMCGVPVHRSDEYLQKLIRLGYRVAVCEQLEDPAEARKRGSKAVVRRDVVRLVTPGTLTEDSLLDTKARNYLTALFRAPAGAEDEDRAIALASLDISTGEFEVGEIAERDLRRRAGPARAERDPCRRDPDRYTVGCVGEDGSVQRSHLSPLPSSTAAPASAI